MVLETDTCEYMHVSVEMVEGGDSPISLTTTFDIIIQLREAMTKVDQVIRAVELQEILQAMITEYEAMPDDCMFQISFVYIDDNQTIAKLGDDAVQIPDGM
jgi:hypothetical protein